MDPAISTIIERGKQLKQYIGERVAKYEYPDSEKDLLIIAYHSVLVEHHDAIHLLIENELFGSAFALVRSLYDSLYRAHWVNACATVDQIGKIFKGKKNAFPNMEVMVEQIDEKYKTQVFWQSIKKNSWSPMCDYTHSGMRQISRRFIQNEVEPNYEIEGIKEVLHGTNVALLLMAFFFFNVYQKHSEIKVIREMIIAYKKS